MGQYKKAILTTVGEKLIAQALAGEIQLNISKAKTSNYAYPSGTDFKSLTDMQGVKQTVSDPVTAVYSDAMIQTRALFSNEEIASTYYIYNIGLYAMDGTEEVLFCIVTAETPDEMPQYNGVASTSYIYNIQNVVQDAAELNITVNPSGTATIQDVLERVDATGGDISETVIETLDTIEDKYPVPTVGEKIKVFLGKIITFLKNIKPLESDTSYYVSASEGSDATGDGSEASPYASITKALSVIPKDLNGYIVTVNIADGTYNEGISVFGFNTGVLQIIGNTTNPESVIIHNTSGYSLFAKSCTTRVVFNGINVDQSPTDSAVAGAFFSTNVVFKNCILNGMSQGTHGITFGSAFVSVSNVEFNDCISCVVSSGSFDDISPGILRIGSCSGTNNIRLINTGKGIVQIVNDILPSVSSANVVSNGALISKSSGGIVGSLTQDIALYVSTTGSDTSGDGTSSNPFATITRALSIVPKDLGGYTANIHIAGGIYNDDIAIKGFGSSGIIMIRLLGDITVNKLTVNYSDHVMCISTTGTYTLTTQYILIADGRLDIQASVNVITTGYVAGYPFTANKASIAVIRGDVYISGNVTMTGNTDVAISMLSVSRGYFGTVKGTGFAIGISVLTSSFITCVTNNISAITPIQSSNGGVVINTNGTQISGIISSGLSCTWGTIGGGYIRHGNATGGVAMVTMMLQIIQTSAITAGQTYTISGLPKPIINTALAVTHPIETTTAYVQSSTGNIVFVPAVNQPVGHYLEFNCTYLTNS